MMKFIALILLFVSTVGFAQEENEGALCDRDKAECMCDAETRDFLVYTNKKGEEKHICLPKCPKGMERNNETRGCIPACEPGTFRVQGKNGKMNGICQACSTFTHEIVEDKCLVKCYPGFERVGFECKEPCQFGFERIGEECSRRCKENEFRDHEGRCKDIKTCAPGYVPDENGACYIKCDVGYEAIRGSCYKDCAFGYERVDLKCVPTCPKNYKRNEQGVCEYCVQ